MLLRNQESSEFEMRIAGYEFPDIEHTRFDSNWLNIAIRVEHPQGKWSATDACMLTDDVTRLADWLDNLAEEKPVGSEQSYIEPELRFELIGKYTKKIRVYFNYELRPSWSPFTGKEVDDLWLDFEINPEELKKAALSLRDDVKRFPIREEMG